MIFNWQERHRDREDFLCWLMISSLTKASSTKDEELKKVLTKKYFEDLGVETKNWTECKFTMQINGVEVPVQETINAIESQMEKQAANAATQLINKNKTLSEIYSILESVKDKMKEELHTILE